jgi:hypothetical protein
VIGENELLDPIEVIVDSVKALIDSIEALLDRSWPDCCGKAKWRILPVCWDWVTHSRPPGQAATGGMRHGRAYQDGRAAA